MPWRLIVVIVIFAVFLSFITFNLDNRCNISFGFMVLSDIPVFLTVFISFALGIFSALPFIINARIKRKDTAVPGKTQEKKETEDVGHRGNYNGGNHGVS